tara:strand:+ start:749 stop:1267 length:519 start_codon:yes stop_codon:yes gene_type:complete
MTEHVTNRGTGAGGSGTNETGLPFERTTDCSFVLTSGIGPQWERKVKKKFLKDMATYELEFYRDNPKMRFHGTREPDEAFVNKEDMRLVIVEKKFQQTGGSVIEKLQGAERKKRHYQQRYPGFTVEYGFLLVPFFYREAPGEIHMLENETDIFVIRVDDTGSWRQQLISVFG